MNIALPPASARVVRGVSCGVAFAVVAALAMVLAFPQPVGAHQYGWSQEGYGWPQGGATEGGGPVNLALTLNAAGHDERETELAWGVRETDGLPAVANNTARAFALGRDHTSAAVAVQVVLASHARGTVNARNTAIARSQHCPGCSTVAAAYQFVIVSDDEVSLSRKAQVLLADARRDLAAVLRSDAGGQRIMNAVHSTADRVRNVLAADLEVKVPAPPQRSIDTKGVRGVTHDG